MCGSGKKRVQTGAEERARNVTERDDLRAQEMHDRLADQRESVSPGLPQIRDTAREGAVEQVATGGYNEPRTEEARQYIREGANPARRLAGDTGYSGAGREGYNEFAVTGGFNPGERESFLRRATAPVKAIYGRLRDSVRRNASANGAAVDSRLARQSAQEAAEASLGGNVELAEQIRKGRIEGLGGLERTRRDAGREQLDAGADISRVGERLGNLEEGIASGRRDAVQNVERLLGLSIDELAQLNDTELRNRAINAGLNYEEVNALLGLAGQKRSALDTVGAVVDIGAKVGSAIGGLP